MRTNKRYTNVTFTKRVDHEAGRHRPPRAPHEPRVCERCGATYRYRRWRGGKALPRTGTAIEHTHGRMLCPACIRIVSGAPCGYLVVKGRFLERHHDELLTVLHTEARRAATDNPLARVMTWQEDHGSTIALTTTTPHLVQRLGHALQKAYGGRVKYDFSHENTVARVTWERNGLRTLKR
jgi:hypothetical protein